MVPTGYELYQKANIHIVPFQFVKNSYFKSLQGSVATLFRWSWKIFIVLCGWFIQDTAYQFLSKSVKLWQNSSGVLLMPHSVLEVKWQEPNTQRLWLNDYNNIPYTLLPVKFSVDLQKYFTFPCCRKNLFFLSTQVMILWNDMKQRRKHQPSNVWLC